MIPQNTSSRACLHAFAIALLAALLTNNAIGQPVFTKITEGAAVTDVARSNGASWVDYDGDGDLDLYVTNGTFGPVRENNALYRNDGNDTFTKVEQNGLVNRSLFSLGNTFADIDNDGDLDAFETVGEGTGSLLYINDGEGNFSGTTGIGGVNPRGWSPAWADFDNDGYVDLSVTHPAGFVGNPITSNFLFRNNGDGTFENVTSSPVSTGTAAYTIGSWSDYDLDGDQDLFMGSGPANGTLAPDNLYQNQLTETGSASFERITTAPIATDNHDGQVMNWIDYDNDGDLDLFVTNWGGQQGGLPDALYRNDDGVYTPITEGNIVTDRMVSLANTWGDVDNDGDLDVFIATGGGQVNVYHQNNGDGTFTRIRQGLAIAESGNSWGATLGDYDQDGDLDLYVANTGGPGFANYLYRNDTANDNGWLIMKLVGTTSNRSGIGAKVRLKAIIGGQQVWQFREVSAQNTFNGQNALEVHFGLGDAARAEEVRIEWPSGQVDAFERAAPNQRITVEEGVAPDITVGVGEGSEEVPTRFLLKQNYPNPFNPSTTIGFSLAQAAPVTLRVFDLAGREVATLYPGLFPQGDHEIRLDFSDQMAALPSGTYLYRVEAGQAAATKAFVLLK